MTNDKPQIWWFTPDKPQHISVGRQRIAAHLRNDGFEVDVVGTTPGTILEAVLKRKHYDVIIGTTRAGAIAGTAIGRLLRKPVIIDHVDPIKQFRETHGRVFGKIVQTFENITFLLAESVLYVYDEENNRITKYADDVTKTNLGVDYERFADPDTDIVNIAQDDLNELPLQENTVIYVGGLEPVYHLQELIEAMEYLPEWSLVVIGDGSLCNLIEAAAAKQNNIHYLGVVPHETVPGYLQGVDVGVCLVDDPNTLKVLEYGAAGLPVLQAKGQAEDRFGEMLTYADLNPEQIAKKIEEAVDSSGAKKLKKFSSSIEWDQVASDYAEVIDNLPKNTFN